MPATRLCRTDAGKLIDGLKDLSALLENLGLEDGSVRLTYGRRKYSWNIYLRHKCSGNHYWRRPEK